MLWMRQDEKNSLSLSIGDGNMGTVQKEAQSKPGAEAPRGSLDDGGVWRWASGSASAGADRGGCRERKAEFGGC